LFQVRGMHAQFTLLSNSLCTMENSFHSLPNIPFTTFVGCSLLIQSSRSISDLKLASFADSTFNVRISLSSGDWMGRLHLESSKYSVELCLEAREASVAVSQCTNGDSLMPVPPPFWQGKKRDSCKPCLIRRCGIPGTSFSHLSVPCNSNVQSPWLGTCPNRRTLYGVVFRNHCTGILCSSTRMN